MTTSGPIWFQSADQQEGMSCLDISPLYPWQFPTRFPCYSFCWILACELWGPFLGSVLCTALGILLALYKYTNANTNTNNVGKIWFSPLSQLARWKTFLAFANSFNDGSFSGVLTQLFLFKGALIASEVKSSQIPSARAGCLNQMNIICGGNSPVLQIVPYQPLVSNPWPGKSNNTLLIPKQNRHLFLLSSPAASPAPGKVTPEDLGPLQASGGRHMGYFRGRGEVTIAGLPLLAYTGFRCLPKDLTIHRYILISVTRNPHLICIDCSYNIWSFLCWKLGLFEELTVLQTCTTISPFLLVPSVECVVE